MKKKFHITWFTDEKKEKLSGITVEDTDITKALNQVLKAKIPIKNGKSVDSSIIKYVIEL